MKKHLFYLSLLLGGSMSFAQMAESSVGATFDSSVPEVVVEGVQEGTLYSNGPYYNVEGSPNVSLLENSTLGMTTLGAGASNATGFLVADDWEVTEPVSVESFQFYTYQTGSTTASTINFVSVIIYDGEPGAGGNIIYGDEFENFYATSDFTGAYRRAETSPSDNTRPIMIVTAETPDLVLQPGTYWIAFNFGGTLASGPWAPPIAILGELNTGNAKQFNPDTASWANLEDGGSFTQLGLPFEVNGETLAAVNDMSSNSIKIYPNPVTNMLNISSKGNIQDVSIMNMSGQVVLKSTDSQINVSSLAKGAYLVRATVDGKVKTTKFVKK